MNHKTLGDTDLLIPEIGLGTWNFKGGVEPLKKGIDLGANLIDTAEGYYTEDVVGEAIKGIREDVIVATKVSGRHLGYEDVLWACENSLKKIGTDYIDLYQVHWPNSSFPIKDTMEALEKLVDEGVVHYIGVSNFSLSEMKEAQHYSPNYKIQSNQIRYNLNDRDIEEDLLPYCIENYITILAYTPLDSGRLCKIEGSTSEKNSILNEIATSNKKTPGQVALNWCINHGNVVAIPKSNSVERTIENCGSSGWKLGEEEIAMLNVIFR
jgi:diketogulonate reductase-like aldo/keto reductase